MRSSIAARPAGIVAFDRRRFHSERRLAWSATASSRDPCQAEGPRAIGHVRYSTTGGTILRNVQPLFAELASGGFAVGHNGNFTNGLTLRRELVATGAICQSTSDTEVILHRRPAPRPRIIDRFVDCLRQLEENPCSLVVLTNKKMIGARDPLGIRPLVLAISMAPTFSARRPALSTSSAPATFATSRMASGGDLRGQDQSHFPFPRVPARPCIFEYIYFSRPDSMVGGRSVYQVRTSMGEELAADRRPMPMW